MNECPEQWKLDVNDRYQAAVGVVTSLSAASLILPIFFLKDMVGMDSGSIIQSISAWIYGAWLSLSFSVLSGIVYYYSSAKWVKLAWQKNADMFGMPVGEGAVEGMLDV